MVLQDPVTAQSLRTVVFTDPVRSVFPMAIDGRSALAALKNGKVTLRDIGSGGTREWWDWA